MFSKNYFRTQALRKRDSLSKKERKEKSELIWKHLISSSIFQYSQKIMAYVSFRSEVETWEGLKICLSEGKELFLPRTDLKKRTLSIHKVDNLEDLFPGPYGILEPPRHNPSPPLSILELIICPGVAFDWRGGRIGYGGGFYDRFLSKVPQALYVALAFSCQVFTRLPLEEHDIRMHYLVTEKGLHKF